MYSYKMAKNIFDFIACFPSTVHFSTKSENTFKYAV
jgi:hypothetical protein